MKKPIIMILGVLLFFGAGLWALNSYIYNEKQADEPSIPASVTDYFQTEMTTRAVADVGQPIEGFDADLLILAYPGLVASDFEGVEALEGVYVVKNNEAVFERTDTIPVSSAMGTITSPGYATMLSNISMRLDIAATGTEAVDLILDEVDTGERIVASFGETAEALDVRITPLELLEDSRCPMNANCIQAGTVNVRVSIESGLGMATETMSLDEWISTEAEIVTFVHVTPFPESTMPIELSDYEFHFRITKR